MQELPRGALTSHAIREQVLRSGSIVVIRNVVAMKRLAEHARHHVSGRDEEDHVAFCSRFERDAKSTALWREVLAEVGQL